MQLAELPLLAGSRKNEGWVSICAGAGPISVADVSIESVGPMLGEVLRYWRVRASAPIAQFFSAVPEIRQN